ncbi:MAG: peptidyl-prolyl cis-trans isomerase [Nitrospiria bacterium]
MKRTELRSTLAFVFLFFLLIPLTSCKKKQERLPSPAVALVGGEPVLSSELEQALAEFSNEIPLPPGGDALENLKKDLLEQLIQTKIFLQEAKRENITLSKDDMDDLIKKNKADYSEEEFNDMLKSKGLTIQRWVQRLDENYTIQKLEEKATSQLEDPTPQEIKEFYETHIEDYKLKAGVKIRQMLLPSEKEANEARQALLKGEDFAKLASEKSISPDKDLGGDVGVLTADQMPEGFEVTLSLPVGAISPVIKTSYGYHIFKVEGRQKERISPLSEESYRIKSLLLQDKKDKQFARWAVNLRNRTEIKIFPDILKTFH